MTIAPERIWAVYKEEDVSLNEDSEIFAAEEDWELNLLAHIYSSPTVKYIRADLSEPTVKPLKWETGIVHWAQPLPGIKYVACSSEGSTWVWWLEGVWRTRMVPSSVHESESAAKADAQADYEQRILSALEDTWTP